MKHKKFLAFFAFMTLVWAGALLGMWDPTAVLYRTGIASKNASIGGEIDSLNGVAVYYNGPVSNVSGRNLAPDGYNLGQKYQCVEFVKRYYYEALHHSMPDSYGHAKDFFNAEIPDGEINPARGLRQYVNGGSTLPRVGDLLVFDGTVFNRYGHVAIVSEVTDKDIEFIQQNPGPAAPSRERLSFVTASGSTSGAASVNGTPPATVNGTMSVSSNSTVGASMPALDASVLLGWLRKEAE